MNVGLFQRYQSLAAAGRKTEAKVAIIEFVQSFSNLAEKVSWTRKYLTRLEFNRQGAIRHELYEGVIFPALLEGHKRQDPWSYLWLGKTIRNCLSSDSLHKEISFQSSLELLKAAYELDPRADEIRGALLHCLITGFEYSVHEWPSGILYGKDGATPEQCAEIAVDVALARRLDAEGRHSDFLRDFESKLIEYRARF